jgi:hypothetical protein
VCSTHHQLLIQDYELETKTVTQQAFQIKNGNMKHEDFHVKGFEFMDEPATDEQKKLILEICKERQIPIDPDGPWPKPFSKWDAGQMIDTLKGKR